MGSFGVERSLTPTAPQLSICIQLYIYIQDFKSLLNILSYYVILVFSPPEVVVCRPNRIGTLAWTANQERSWTIMDHER